MGAPTIRNGKIEILNEEFFYNLKAINLTGIRYIDEDKKMQPNSTPPDDNQITQKPCFRALTVIELTGLYFNSETNRPQ